MKKVKQFVKQKVNNEDSMGNKPRKLATNHGVPGAIRTLDPLLRRQNLNLKVHKVVNT